MDKTFIGLNCSSLDKGIESEQITKVEILNNGGEIVGQAGTDTGKTLTAINPDGTNAMAAYILSQVSGYVQRGYSASQAIIDPATELGDGVTVGGIYSVIASEDINFDALYTSDISAPDADEVDDEYPYQTYQQRVEKKVATVFSKITKTQNSISLIVDSTTGNVTAAQIVAAINDAESTVKISADHVSISGYVTFSDLSTEGQTSINGANITTGTISANRLDLSGTLQVGSNISSLTNDSGYQTSSGVTTIIGNTVTTGYVNALGITAQSIKGNTISIIDDDGYTAATFYLTGASSISSQKLEIDSGAIELYTTNGDINLGTHTYNGSNVSALQLYGSQSKVACIGNFVPNSSSLYDLGSSGLYWRNIYCYNSVIDLSDRNEKKDINYIINIDDFFDVLKPVSYKMIHGTSDRTHYGMIAQDVENALLQVGMTSKDFAGLIKHTDEDSNVHYGLRYGEFVSICIDQIQKLKSRVKALEVTE